MKWLLLILSLLLSQSLAEYPLYIDELADIVNWEDERILEQLEDDDYTPRFEILARVRDIFQRQTPALQASSFYMFNDTFTPQKILLVENVHHLEAAYHALVTNKENTRAARVAHMMRQHEMRGTADIFRRILDIQGDLKLSQSDAKKLIRDLKRMLY